MILCSICCVWKAYVFIWENEKEWDGFTSERLNPFQNVEAFEWALPKKDYIESVFSKIGKMKIRKDRFEILRFASNHSLFSLITFGAIGLDWGNDFKKKDDELSPDWVKWVMNKKRIKDQSVEKELEQN